MSNRPGLIAEEISATGNIIGRYMDTPIPAWIQTASGDRYSFDRTLTDPSQLNQGDIFIPPGLVYCRQI